MRTKNKRKTSTFLMSYHYTTISGEQGFGTCETTIEDRKFHYRNLSPVVESIKKENSWEFSFLGNNTFFKRKISGFKLFFQKKKK